MARAGLTPQRVTIAGAELADEVGLDKVTMSPVARRLGVKDASLYAHVRNLEDLRGRIALLAADEKTIRIAEATSGRAGKDALVAFADAWRQYAHEHPGRYTATQTRIRTAARGRTDLRHAARLRTGRTRPDRRGPVAAQHVPRLRRPGGLGRVRARAFAAAVLGLLTAHPERVERLVAHEPPVVEVLPDAPAHRALVARVRATFHAEGLMPAMAVFAAGLTKDGAAPTGPKAVTELPPQAAARAERTMANLPYFVGRIVPSFMSYAPDIHRLEALSDRLVLACGQDSRGELPYRPAAFLAERLGTELRHFPGGHTGLTTHPTEFGERLRKEPTGPLNGTSEPAGGCTGTPRTANEDSRERP